MLALTCCRSYLKGPELHSFGILLASLLDPQEFKPVLVVFGGDSDDVLDGEVWSSPAVQFEIASNFVDVGEALLIYLQAKVQVVLAHHFGQLSQMVLHLF